MATSQRKRVAVVVLGDFGRSPRMQYHTLSLAKQADVDVDVVAYEGVAPIEDVLAHPRISLHLVKPPPFQRLPRLAFLLLAPLKVLLQLAQLFWLLLVTIPRPHALLVQNPPSIPTLLVAVTVQRLRGSRLIIDWHNFGYSLLAMRLGARHPVVHFSRWYEQVLGRRGDAHLCVTRAMRKELATRWGVLATVLYDCAPASFHACTPEERHELFTRLARDIRVVTVGGDDADEMEQARERTVATEAVHVPPRARVGEGTAGVGSVGAGVEQPPRVRQRGKKASRPGKGDEHASSNGGGSNGDDGSRGRSVRMRADRPALLVTSTSWTADEDVGMLLDAAVEYDKRLAAMMAEGERGAPGSKDEAEPGKKDKPAKSRPEQEGESAAKAGASAPTGAVASTRNAVGKARRSVPDRWGNVSDDEDKDPKVLLFEEEMARGAVGGRARPPPSVLFQTGAPLPSLLILITGKGPMRHAFEQRLAKVRLRRVVFRTLWLAAEDYPRLLGSVDLGVCLHTSSSGLDLPMKVVDMFGCGLPVCAVRYACIHELVRHGENGLLFSSAGQLAQYLCDLFQGFHGDDGVGTEQLDKLRANARAKGSASRWEEEWAKCALPVIREQCGELVKRD